MEKNPNIDPERIKINPDSEMDIRIEYIGKKQHPILLVENFYKDPDYIRNTVLKHKFKIYEAVGEEWLKGIYLKLDYTQFIHFLHDTYSKRFGFTQSAEQIYLDPNGWQFSRIHSLSKEDVVNNIHVDANMLQGVTFLNPPDQCRGGVSFFKHKYFELEEFIEPEEVFHLCLIQSGIQIDLPFPPRVDRRAIQNIIQTGAFEHILKLLEKCDNNHETLYTTLKSLFTRERNILMASWEEVKTIEMKYNRFICFPAFLPHAINYEHGWFGDSNETRRLTQNFDIGWPLL